MSMTSSLERVFHQTTGDKYECLFHRNHLVSILKFDFIEEIEMQGGKGRRYSEPYSIHNFYGVQKGIHLHDFKKHIESRDDLRCRFRWITQEELDARD